MYGSIFKLKVKIEDEYLLKKNLITEDGFTLVAEDGSKLRTEWGV